jgi:hypothetical protein
MTMRLPLGRRSQVAAVTLVALLCTATGGDLGIVWGDGHHPGGPPVDVPVKLPPRKVSVPE